MAASDIEAMYRVFGHSVQRRARQILGSDDEADEVLQEIFVRLVAHPEKFEQRSSPATFLYAVTTHACLSRLRDRKNRQRLLDQQVRPWQSDVDPRPRKQPWLCARCSPRCPTTRRAPRSTISSTA